MKHDSREHGCSSKKRNRGGPIKRVVRGLSKRFGVDRGWVIAGFVVGFIFAPLLALLAFGTAWLWAGDPARFEETTRNAGERVRRIYEAAFAHFDGGRSTSPVSASSEPPVEFPDLVRDFEDLERRTGSMEKFVTSDEGRLHREFQRMRE